MKAMSGIFLFLFVISAYAHTHESEMPKEFQDEKFIKASVKYDAFHLEINDLKSRDLDITGVNLKTGEIDVYVSEKQYESLIQAGKRIVGVEKNYLPLRPDDEYKNPEEIEQFLKDISSRYPNISKVISIGQSLEGRNIWAIKISDNPELDELEPAILFNSMHHAREVMTPEVGIDIAEYLLTNYETEKDVKEWVDNSEIWVVPMLNVDGNMKVWGLNSMWRKNTRGGYGVDINRNYPYAWGSCRGSSRFTWSQTYRGPSAASEPETKALMGLVAAIKPVFNISYHSYSELVLYPYGCPGQKTLTHEVVAKIGKELGDKLDYRPGTPWEILYGVDGGDVDWMYAEHQVIPYVIELNSNREGFQPNYKRWRQPTVERNRAGWMMLLDKLTQSGVRGIVRDSSGDIINNYKVDIFKKINGKRSLFQTYRGNPDGSYHLILNPGDYDFVFKRLDARAVREANLNIGANRENLDIQF